jgi:hypothetical protein
MHPAAMLAVWVVGGAALYLRGGAWGVWSFHALTGCGVALLWWRGERVVPPRAAWLSLGSLRLARWLAISLPVPANELGLFFATSAPLAVLQYVLAFFELVASRWVARQWARWRDGATIA